MQQTLDSLSDIYYSLSINFFFSLGLWVESKNRDRIEDGLLFLASPSPPPVKCDLNFLATLQASHWFLLEVFSPLPHGAVYTTSKR